VKYNAKDEDLKKLVLIINEFRGLLGRMRTRRISIRSRKIFQDYSDVFMKLYILITVDSKYNIINGR